MIAVDTSQRTFWKHYDNCFSPSSDQRQSLYSEKMLNFDDDGSNIFSDHSINIGCIPIIAPNQFPHGEDNLTLFIIR